MEADDEWSVDHVQEHIEQLIMQDADLEKMLLGIPEGLRGEILLEALTRVALSIENAMEVG